MTSAALSPGTTRDVLAHLGVARGAPSLALLDALIDAYTRAVPWETASRIVRRSHMADTAAFPRWPEEFWAGAMRRGAGGTCFESNYAFFGLLCALGYAGYLTINDMDPSVGCHTAIVLSIDGARWLVDVGIPLHVSLPLDAEAIRQRTGPFHTYTVRPTREARFVIERDRHPRPYIYTLIDRPVPDAAYRAATVADYGPNGLFLDRVIVTKVVGGQSWRFNGGDAPPHLESFHDGTRADHPIAGDVAAAVADRFALDGAIIRAALRVTETDRATSTHPASR